MEFEQFTKMMVENEFLVTGLNKIGGIGIDSYLNNKVMGNGSDVIVSVLDESTNNSKIRFSWSTSRMGSSHIVK